MNTNSKKRLKNKLEKVGLLKFFTKLNKLLGIYKLLQFANGFKYYLFNNIITNLPNHFIRILYIKNILRIKIGKSCFIHMGVRLNGNINIGNHTVIGRNCVLLGDITIKDNVSITAETYIFTSSHIIDSPTFECFYKKVIIEDHAWIGVRAIILPGVIVGKGAVLGAASVATKDIPAFSVFAGVPAREVRKRSEMINYKLSYSPYFE